MQSHAWARAVRAGGRLVAGLCLLAGLSAAAPAAAAGSPGPVVTGVRPASASIAGGDTVTVTGHGFTDTRAVRLLSPPGTRGAALPVYVQYTVVSDRTLRLIVPAHALGPVWVQVQTPLNTNSYSVKNRLVYSNSAPESKDPPGKDALGALLLAILIGMIIGRSRCE